MAAERAIAAYENFVDGIFHGGYIFFAINHLASLPNEAAWALTWSNSSLVTQRLDANNDDDKQLRIRQF